MLFNLQGLWWPAYISLHIDSKFVFVCGLVVLPDSQGISAGFRGFSPWCGHHSQIQARPRWLHGSGHKWITLYRAWHRLTGLIERLISLCAACPQGCLLLTSQPLGSPCPFWGKHCCFYKLMLHLKSFFPQRALRLERVGINIPDSAGFIFQSRF